MTTLKAEEEGAGGVSNSSSLTSHELCTMRPFLPQLGVFLRLFECESRGHTVVFDA